MSNGNVTITVEAIGAEEAAAGLRGVIAPITEMDATLNAYLDAQLRAEGAADVWTTTLGRTVPAVEKAADRVFHLSEAELAAAEAAEVQANALQRAANAARMEMPEMEAVAATSVRGERAMTRLGLAAMMMAEGTRGGVYALRSMSFALYTLAPAAAEIILPLTLVTAGVEYLSKKSAEAQKPLEDLLKTLRSGGPESMQRSQVGQVADEMAQLNARIAEADRLAARPLAGSLAGSAILSLVGKDPEKLREQIEALNDALRIFSIHTEHSQREERAKKLADAIREQNRALVDQIAHLGMTASQWARYQDAQKGIGGRREGELEWERTILGVGQITTPTLRTDDLNAMLDRQLNLGQGARLEHLRSAAGVERTRAPGGDELAEAERFYEQLTDRQNRYAAAQERLNTLLKAGRIGHDEYVQAMLRVTEQYGKTSTAQRIATDGFEMFGKSLADSLGQGKNALDAFGKAMEQTVAKSIESAGAAELATGAALLLVDPAKGALEMAAGTALIAIGEALAGNIGGGGVGGGGASAASTYGANTQQATQWPGSRTLVIQGGILDMTDPRQRDALAGAIRELGGLGDLQVVAG